MVKAINDSVFPGVSPPVLVANQKFRVVGLRIVDQFEDFCNNLAELFGLQIL
jgi:hypothetical protein